MVAYENNGWARAGFLVLGGALVMAACSTDANNSPGDSDDSGSGTESSSSGGSSSSKSSSGTGGSGGSGGDRASSGSGGSGGECDTGDEGCECFPNDTCNGSLSCLSGLCVDASASGGTGGDGSGGGTTQGSGGDGSGGATQGSGGGATQGSGGSGTGGDPTGGTGGDGSGGGTTQGSGGTGGMDEVSDETIIDNFSSCDEGISIVAGRDGFWYEFGDDDINFQGDVGEPASGFSSQECAAWTNGGCTDTACSFGGNGFTFRANEGGYDISAYSGIVFSIETDQALWVVVHSTNGGAWGATISATGSSLANRSISFNSLSESADSLAALDLTSVRSIEFTATEPDPGYGWAIWDVRFVD